MKATALLIKNQSGSVTIETLSRGHVVTACGQAWHQAHPNMREFLSAKNRRVTYLIAEDWEIEGIEEYNCYFWRTGIYAHFAYCLNLYTGAHKFRTRAAPSLDWGNLVIRWEKFLNICPEAGEKRLRDDRMYALVCVPTSEYE